MLEIEKFSLKYQLKPVLLTFVYPAVTRYLDFLVKDVNAQNIDEFVLLIFNDGVKNPNKYFDKVKIPYLISDAVGKNPMEVRFAGLEQLKKTAFRQFIFQDSDDGLSTNRIQVVSQLLNNYPLVVNDLDLIDEKGMIFQELIWKNRFEENPSFKFQELSTSNYAGLGNSAITSELLRFLPPKPTKELIAVDWYLFFCALRLSGVKGYRTSSCSSRYRQHSNNTVGLQQPNKERIHTAIQLHFQALKELGIEIVVNHTKVSNQRPDAFWWETE